MTLPWLKIKAAVKGLIPVSMPYTPLLSDGDSRPYFGTYEGQKYGYFDTQSCWDFSGAEIIETRLEILAAMGKIPEATMKWLRSMKYLDEQGDFYLSRRWIAILSGVRSDGNSQQNFWDLAAVAGIIPNWMLPYSPQDAAKDLTRDQFDNDYFNPQVITEAMEKMGLEFLKRFEIKAKTFNGGYYSDIRDTLKYYLKEGSMQWGIPVPQDGSWNNPLVKMPKGRLQADHAVEGAKIDDSGTFPVHIFDSYKPSDKQLSVDYYIPYLTRVLIIPK